jgi:SAM-dependent methyltransferase
LSRGVLVSDWSRRIEQQLRTLRELLKGCESVLDLGCGESSPLAAIRHVRKIGVDGWAKSLDAARSIGSHDEFICGDIFAVLNSLESSSVDAVVALDVIEHFEKPRGGLLLKEMERVARRRVIVTTPNGFLAQEGGDNPMQRHLCGWSPSEFFSRGYQVNGLYGPKWLRGFGHELRLPLSILLMVSWLGAPMAFVRPTIAAGLICSRDMDSQEFEG